MIRVIIGTIAVLAGFAVVERSVDARTGQPGSCASIVVHALSPPQDSVTVRSGPTMNSSTTGALRGGTAVSLSAARGGWAHIATTHAPYLEGWAPADQLWTGVKAGRALYSLPGPLGRLLATPYADAESFRVLGCHGPWLHVINARTGAGWIDNRQS